MENLNSVDLKLSQEESRDIIEFLARKRNIKSYKGKSSNELLQAIKENKDNQKQSKNKERIDDIREDLKDLSYKLSKSELKEIFQKKYKKFIKRIYKICLNYQLIKIIMNQY